MRWIKDNPTLAAGIGLPLLLIVLFGIAASIPKMLVEPPQYDLVFYGENYANKPEAKVILSVINGRIRAQYSRNTQEYGGYNKVLYYYYARDNNTRQIDIVPPDMGTSQWQDFTVPDVSGLRLDTSLTAPDGYSYEAYRRSSGGDIANMFFMGGYRQHGPVISKDGRTISLQPGRDTYHGYNMHFLGWVVKE